MIVGLILRILVALIGLFCVVAAIVAALRAFQSRHSSARKMYSVGRQEARQGAKLGFLRALVLLVVGLILLGISGLLFAFGNGETVLTTATGTPSPTVLVTLTRPASPTPSESETPTTNPTIAAATALAPPAGSTAVSTQPVGTPVVSTIGPPTAGPSETPTETPTITPTSPPSAVVNSPVGLYLREAPGGTQEIELLPDGTVLILLPGRTTIDGQEWQEVRTPSGLEGWVAVAFIIYQ